MTLEKSPPFPSPSSPSAAVAVIDVGSNTVKLLVVGRNEANLPTALGLRTIEARLEAGLGGERPELSEEGMNRGLRAIEELAIEARTFVPSLVTVVATSAVRDAANREIFRDRVRRATGADLRILTGTEEASLIGRGLTCDPSLSRLRDFYVFDLGGGSLECLSFQDRTVRQAISVKLGCVRLTEKFVPDPAQPFPPTAARSIHRHVQIELARSGFALNLGPEPVAVATGGTITTARAIIAAQEGKAFDETDPSLPVKLLRDLLALIGPLPLEERRRVPGLSAGRADIFPAALATLISVAEGGQFASFRHSLYNLRWGVAAELLHL